MAMTQTVIIDFQADFSSVQDAVDILEKTGKVDADLAATFRKTNTEIAKQGQALKTTSQQGTASIQSFTKLSQLMQQFPKSGMNRYLLQVGQELTAAGMKATEFYKKIDPKDTTPRIQTLRQELKLVKEQMQQAALAGGILSDEYKKLKIRAGQLDDTMKDVNRDISNAGSDTRGIDNVVGSISALAGGYSAVQGAAALFGDESEDLQKALLKVNAAMALATGLQQVSNALTKQGSLYRLADAAATGVQTIAQRLFTVVVGQSVGVLKVFRIALASTGIGLLVIGLAALISRMGGASRATKQLKKDLEDLRAGTDAAIEAVSREGEISQALLEQQGATQSKISKQKLSDLEKQQALEEGNLIQLQNKEREVKREREEAEKRFGFSTKKNQKDIEAAVIKSEENIAARRHEIRKAQINIQTEENNERKKAAEDAVKTEGDSLSEIARKRKEAADRARELLLEDAKAAAEIRVLSAKQGSDEELAARRQLLGAELDLALNNEELTKNQRLLIVDQYFKAYEQLNKDSQARNAQIEIDTLSRSLLNRNISNENRALLEEAFIRKQAEIEIAAAVGNAEKIKLIAAKRDQDIADAKIASIRKSANEEIALSGAQGGVQRRALEGVAANEKLKGDIRIAAIRQLSDIETKAIDRQIKANRDAFAVQGADQKALEIEYEQLLDQKAAAAEKTEKDITGIVLSENDKRKASDIAYIQATIAGLQGLADIVGGIQANEQERTQNVIETRRREIEELLDAGAITEKEARIRNKRLNEEERQAKIKAAQQIKNLAVFQAVLAIPQAYLAGLQTPVIGAIMGPIFAGIAAVQAGIIAARPVPQFATGKKGSYQGLGTVAEAGAELIQRGDGSMEVATRRQLVYLGSRDKVFTATETKNMMPFVNKEVMSGAKVNGFDYDKLAKAVKQSPSNTSINIDKEFISESVASGLMRVNYFDRYYSSK